MLNKKTPVFKDPVLSKQPLAGPDSAGASIASAADKLRVPAIKESLGKVLSFVDSHLENAGCPFPIQMQIDVAMEEIFANIAHYAYKHGKGDAEISIQIEGEPKQAVITLTDSGEPFDPLEKTDPDITLSAEDREIGGLGIFIVKKTMDALDYRREHGKNILTIRKSLVKKKKS